jgi:hypothetical protein
MGWPSLALRSGFGVSGTRILLFQLIRRSHELDFVVSKLTPRLITSLGYKIFFLFAAINGIGNTSFSLFVVISNCTAVQPSDEKVQSYS